MASTSITSTGATVTDRRMVLILAITIPVSILLITILVILWHRRSKKSCSPAQHILPFNSQPQAPPTFLQRHLSNLRTWQKPCSSPSSAPSDSTSQRMTGPLRHDPNHLPFLAQAAPVHGEKRPVKNTWQSFKARQARIQEQRDLEMQAGVGSSAREWQHKPKGPAYWKKVGEEMEAKKGAMTKVWSKATL